VIFIRKGALVPSFVAAIALFAGVAEVSLSVVSDASGSVAAQAGERIVLYSDPIHEAYVANADDEERGAVSNPFGVHLSRAAAGLTATKGPYAGDEAVFSFNVYASSSLNTKVGSAVYTCQYYFDKNAFCDVSFQLKGGTLIGAGTLNFDAKKFGLAITGGYGKYGGATGDVQATPVGKTSQRLAFTLD